MLVVATSSPLLRRFPKCQADVRLMVSEQSAKESIGIYEA